MFLFRATFLTLSLTFTLNVVAQDYMGMFNASNTAGINIAGTIAVNSSIKKQAQNAAARKKGQRASAEHLDALKSAAVAKMTFEPSPTISRRVKDEFRVAVQRADPAKAEHIAAVLAAQNVIADFDRDMAPYGLQSNNVAHAMTAYWVTMWMIAHQAPEPSKDTVAAVRQQVIENMLRNEMITRATNEQRQELTEGLIYETMFALGQRAHAVRMGNANELRNLAVHTQRNISKLGINLKSLKLTPSGFSGT